MDRWLVDDRMDGQLNEWLAHEHGNGGGAEAGGNAEGGLGGLGGVSEEAGEPLF